MIIGIDATSANKKERTGVEWYTFHLIQNLKEVIPASERVILYSANPLQDDLKQLPSNWKSGVLKWPPKFGWNTFRLSWEMWRRKPDVLFVPGNRLPRIVGSNTVTTVHDIGPDRIPGKYEAKVRKKISRATKVAGKKATKIITVSEFTKRELMEKYKIAEGRITAIPLAADSKRYRQLEDKEQQQVLAKHRLSRNYLFHIGRLETKKNISALIRAFDTFKKRRGVGDPFQLVLAGSPGYGFGTIKKYIDGSEFKDQIRLLGRVDENDVPALMNAATLYLFPSWYEGFGIPALETMSCGTAMIASDIGALHEVAGNAALFVSPKEPERWTKAIQELISNGTKRDDLVAKGLERAKQFSWNKTAEQTWKVFQGFRTKKSEMHLEQSDEDVNLLE
jgi:glycosyltransferase involved in cell wall biosynthesis